MAGDWIKVEHATASKPEVCMAAEMLGITRREMVGLCVDYWIWIDNNLGDSCDGVVTLVTRKSVEDVMHCAGFAAVLERMGWAKFDDEKRTLTIINWDRHTGTSAKTRGLTQKRMKRLRDDSVTQNASPEKRRVKYLSIPDGFGISERVRAWAEAKQHQNLEAHLEHFVGYAVATGKTYADWDQAFMNAVRDNWAKIGQLKPVAGSGGSQWWLSESGTMAKAAELGIAARGGESFNDFRGRIRQQLEKRRA